MIRRATADDVNAVYILMRQLSNHDFTKKQFESCYRYNLENNHILVCEQDQYIHGCGVLDIHYHLHFSKKTAEIAELIVDENSRSRGIGRDLLTAFEDVAIGNGCVRLEVDSNKVREDAHRFYLREGFLETHKKLTKEL
jgi:PhnO protein